MIKVSTIILQNLIFLSLTWPLLISLLILVCSALADHTDHESRPKLLQTNRSLKVKLLMDALFAPYLFTIYYVTNSLCATKHDRNFCTSICNTAINIAWRCHIDVRIFHCCQSGLRSIDGGIQLHLINLIQQLIHYLLECFNICYGYGDSH